MTSLNKPLPSMQKYHPDEQETGSWSLHDILFLLFRHKGKILLTTAVGLAAAVAAYFTSPPQYESRAKLLVRYVLDRSAVDPLDNQTKTLGNYSENLINAEIEILTSWDLAVQVVDSIGLERLSPKPGGRVTKIQAAHSILGGLNVLPSKGVNVILVSYQDQDPELAVRVLEELLNRYFAKHLEVHRSAGAFDFVTQQTDQVRTRLNQTEDELRRLKSKAGINSLAESIALLDTRAAKGQGELDATMAEYAEQQARVKEIEKSFPTAPDPPASTPTAKAPLNREDSRQYQALIEAATLLRQKGMELLSKYTSENSQVKANAEQLAVLERQRREMEKKFPSLVGTVGLTPSSAGRGPQLDLLTERARLAALQAKIDVLSTQLRDGKEQSARLSEFATRIGQLERTKAVEETNYKYFEASLEKARIDEALDPSKLPNISVVQKPSPAMRAISNLKKLVLGLALGGLGLGLAFALLTELVLDRTVQRAIELEARMHIPLILSIPNLKLNGRGQLALVRRNGDHSSLDANGHDGPIRETASWEFGHFIRPFSQALRDRLVLYFELNRMTHKPKLVAVTGMASGAGTSTLASGLAAALSETGDGKVLLVDMNVAHPEVHPFFEGQPMHSLADALQPRSDIASAAENLYLATATSPGVGTAQLIPKRFYDLVPYFKASDFDYIIFDMPPLSQSSATLAMANLMDKVLLVVEAGKSGREAVKRAYGDLSAARAKVSAVFNKSRSYGPKWLQVEA